VLPLQCFDLGRLHQLLTTAAHFCFITVVAYVCTSDGFGNWCLAANLIYKIPWSGSPENRRFVACNRSRAVDHYIYALFDIYALFALGSRPLGGGSAPAVGHECAGISRAAPHNHSPSLQPPHVDVEAHPVDSLN
jgi:hypothetical protein